MKTSWHVGKIGNQARRARRRARIEECKKGRRQASKQLSLRLGWQACTKAIINAEMIRTKRVAIKEQKCAHRTEQKYPVKAKHLWNSRENLLRSVFVYSNDICRHRLLMWVLGNVYRKIAKQNEQSERDITKTRRKKSERNDPNRSFKSKTYV